MKRPHAPGCVTPGTRGVSSWVLRCVDASNRQALFERIDAMMGGDSLQKVNQLVKGVRSLELLAMQRRLDELCVSCARTQPEVVDLPDRSASFAFCHNNALCDEVRAIG